MGRDRGCVYVVCVEGGGGESGNHGYSCKFYFAVRMNILTL